MHRKRYFPADLKPYPLHYAALRGHTDDIRDFISTGHNHYEPIQDGETPLHVAIAGRQVDAAQLLVEEFSKDFQLVGKHLTTNCGCDPEDKFWLSQSILIAVGEEQCQRVKHLEASCIPIVNPKETILIILKHPIGNEKVAVLDPSRIEHLELFKLIKSLFSNGILSWNSTGPAGNCESLLQLAAYYGNADLLERLIEQGADLTLAGPGKRTAFHAACDASQKETIALLLTKFLYRFNPTALDENAQHGLHYILNRKNRDSFELVVEKMVEFRVRKFSETPFAAFNYIFILENDEWPFTGIWSQLDAAFWNGTIETVLERYQYDLTYQWKEVTVLIDMITYKKAQRYCMKKIREKSELLKVSSSNGFTVLHALICANEVKLVDELYTNRSELKKLFENNAAIMALSSIMQLGFIEMMEFVLYNHWSFFRENLSNLNEQVIQSYITPNLEKVFEVLLSYLPELESCISKRKSEMYEIWFAATQDFNDIYDQLLRDFSSTRENITKSDKHLDSYSTANGHSLLKQAIYENELDLVQQLLDAKVNIDHLDSDDRHAIHHVRSSEMLQLLIDQHPEGSALINRKDRNGFTLLHILCPARVNHKQELILKLLKLGAKLDERTTDQTTVLFYTYDEELFKFFTQGIESAGFLSIDPDLRDIEGNTALHRHLRHLNSHISSVMLQSTRSFVSFNDKGDSYLSYLLCFERDIFNSVFKSVLELHPDKTCEMFEAEFKRSRDRTSQLFVKACLQINVYCIERFMQMDLNFSEITTLALLSGFELPSPHLMFWLLEKNIDVDLRNSNGQNALMILTSMFGEAKRIGYDTRIVQKMIDCGLDIDEVDCNGETVMHYAFRKGEMELIEVLLENGAISCMQNEEGKEPYEVAPSYISHILKYLQ